MCMHMLLQWILIMYTLCMHGYNKEENTYKLYVLLYKHARAYVLLSMYEHVSY